MDFSFNEEKVKKEYYKLVGISNLGKKTISGYMKNRGIITQDKHQEFSIGEAHFLRIAASMLCSPNKDCGKECMDHIFKGSIQPTKVLVVHAPATTYSIYDFFEFCTEGIKCFVPYLEIDKITDLLIEANLPLISLKMGNKLNGNTVAYITALIVSKKIQGASIDSDAILSEVTDDKEVVILADLLRLSCFIETIMSELRCSVNNALG